MTETLTETALVTERLAQWLSGVTFDQLPESVRRKAVDVIYDSVGGMAACSVLPEVRAVVELIDQQGSKPECTVIGHSRPASVVNAAMANGGMAHGDEVDPVHTTSVGGHVAAGPVPTALTIGEWLGSSGQDVIRAVTLGYELGGRLMTIFYRERDYGSRRFYHTAVAANVTSAVTAGLLFGLEPKALQIAMCLAVYQAAGPDNMTTDPGHMGKTFQVAAANRNGVTAALLARQGCFAPLDILDGKPGLFDAYLGVSESGAELLDELGRYYAITDVMHKQYSAGTPNQTYLQGLFKILKQHRVAPDNIAEIEIHMPARGVKRVPTTRHASISGIKVCAIAAATGKLDFYHLHGPAEAVEATIKSMEQRVRFVGREDWTDMDQGRHAIVILRTRDGQTFEEEVWHQPMTRADLEEKFRGLVEPRFGAAKTAHLKELLDGLESAASIRPLMHQLRG
jgi:2-methylcitrate dehydratase PrpD